MLWPSTLSLSLIQLPEVAPPLYRCSNRAQRGEEAHQAAEAFQLGWGRDGLGLGMGTPGLATRDEMSMDLGSRPDRHWTSHLASPSLSLPLLLNGYHEKGPPSLPVQSEAQARMQGCSQAGPCLPSPLDGTLCPAAEEGQAQTPGLGNSGSYKVI